MQTQKMEAELIELMQPINEQRDSETIVNFAVEVNGEETEFVIVTG